MSTSSEINDDILSVLAKIQSNFERVSWLGHVFNGNFISTVLSLQANAAVMALNTKTKQLCEHHSKIEQTLGSIQTPIRGAVTDHMTQAIAAAAAHQ
jgi:hypothetical protein